MEVSYSLLELICCVYMSFPRSLRLYFSVLSPFFLNLLVPA